MFAARHMTTPVLVRPRLGDGAYGPVFGEVVTVMCWPQEESRQVRSASGEEVVSSARLWCLAENGSAFTPGAEVAYLGRATQVVSVAVHDPGAIRTDRLLEAALL